MEEDFFFDPPHGKEIKNENGEVISKCLLDKPGITDTEDQIVVTSWSAQIFTSEWEDTVKQWLNLKERDRPIITIDDVQFKVVGGLVGFAPDSIISRMPLSPEFETEE